MYNYFFKHFSLEFRTLPTQCYEGLSSNSILTVCIGSYISGRVTFNYFKCVLSFLSCLVTRFSIKITIILLCMQFVFDRYVCSTTTAAFLSFII